MLGWKDNSMKALREIYMDYAPFKGGYVWSPLGFGGGYMLRCLYGLGA